LPHILMDHSAVDPREELFERLGDISDIELFHNNVVVAIYKRPEKTKSGIILTSSHLEEDVYQGKCGLVVKMGPSAFQSDGNWSMPDIKVGDWVFFRASDGWNMSIRGNDKKEAVQCRRLKDTSIEGRITHPDMIW